MIKFRIYLSLIAALATGALVFAEPASPLISNGSPPQRAWWPTPDLPVFGQAKPDTICVYVLGAARRPGVYFLNRDATVGAAIEAAQGDSEADWKHFCGLVRPMPLDVPKIIRFQNRETDEKIPLKDGDQIYLGHETY